MCSWLLCIVKRREEGGGREGEGGGGRERGRGRRGERGGGRGEGGGGGRRGEGGGRRGEGEEGGGREEDVDLPIENGKQYLPRCLIWCASIPLIPYMVRFYTANTLYGALLFR